MQGIPLELYLSISPTREIMLTKLFDLNYLFCIILFA